MCKQILTCANLELNVVRSTTFYLRMTICCQTYCTYYVQYVFHVLRIHAIILRSRSQYVNTEVVRSSQAHLVLRLSDGPSLFFIVPRRIGLTFSLYL